MYINFKNIEVKVLTIPSNTSRFDYFKYVFKDKLNFDIYYGVTLPRPLGCDISLIKLWNIIKPPILILEDDCCPTEWFKTELNVPDDADVVHIGTSGWGVKDGRSEWNNLSISKYNDDYYRLYNSLGCHAILITNKTGAELFLEKQKEAINRKDHGDIYLAVASNKHLILTPKDGPYFYQNDAHTEPITKFLWKDHLDKYLYSCQ